MPRIIRGNTYQLVLKFISGRIFAYRESELLLHYIAHRTGRQTSTILRIWKQWVPEGHAERHAGSQRIPVTNYREDKHIVKSALQNRIITSRTFS